MKFDQTKLLKKGLFVAGGAALGFAYYYFIGCSSGTCPITSSPWISTGYGAMIGGLFGLDNRKKRKSDQTETHSD